jgi:hypothetical protein
MPPLLCKITLIAILATGANVLAAPVLYVGSLSGPAESPPNASTATGFAGVTIDSVAHTMAISASFSGLSSIDTAAHIHCCTTTPLTSTAGVATQVPAFSGFPLGVTAGTYEDFVFDLTQLSTYNSSFVTANGGTAAGAEAALETGVAAGRAYFNIHTMIFPGGEIRAFLVPDTLFGNGFEAM